MLVCNHCGTLKDESEIKSVTESHGETHDNLICSCGGDFVEATECKVCGEWFENSELYGVCEACLEQHETVDTALKIGDENRESVGINGLVAYILTEDQINHILEAHIREHFADHSKEVAGYCEDDKWWFSDYVVQEEKGVD